MTPIHNNGYGTIRRKPSLWQFVVNDLPVLILTIVGLVVAGMDGYAFGNLLFWASLIIGICLVYRCFYLKRMVFYITPEQIIYEHGVFHRTRDYIELYRVVDFREDSNFMQQLFGIKTIKVYSGDRTTPRLDMTGMDRSDNLIPHIRELVNFNRRNSGVYEITNR